MPDHRIGYLLQKLVLVDMADTAVKLKVMDKGS